jgi:hypothetical protein
MPILAFVAHQLDVSPASWRDYARRDETRRSHLADLSRRFGHLVFSRADFHALVAFAMPIAQTVTQSSRLAGIVIDEMRRRRLLLPPVTVIEAIVRRARQQAGDLVHDVLAGDLGEPERATLDALLSRRDDKSATWLSWLRNRPYRRPAQYPATDRTARPSSRAGPGGRAPRPSRRHSTGSPTRRRASRRSIWRNCPTYAVMRSLALPASGLRKA